MKKTKLTTSKPKPISHPPPINYDQENIEEYEPEEDGTGYQPNNIVPSYEESGGGESVKVACRLRPMINLEKSRGDENCVKSINSTSVQFVHKGNMRQYRFNYVLDDSTSQSEVFMNTNVKEMIISAMEGYSATIFAYGQTGSGKTYTYRFIT